MGLDQRRLRLRDARRQVPLPLALPADPLPGGERDEDEARVTVVERHGARLVAAVGPLPIAVDLQAAVLDYRDRDVRVRTRSF